MVKCSFFIALGLNTCTVYDALILHDYHVGAKWNAFKFHLEVQLLPANKYSENSHTVNGCSANQNTGIPLYFQCTFTATICSVDEGNLSQLFKRSAITLFLSVSSSLGLLAHPSSTSADITEDTVVVIVGVTQLSFAVRNYWFLL